MNHIILGAFFGDEGKGQLVNNLCQQYSHPLCVRFSGGPQVGHNVKHNIITHCFSNFGSGSLVGTPTYWSKYCTVDPLTTLIELRVLNSCGIKPTIVYSPLCELITPLDIWYQRQDQNNRQHGTVGTGFKACLDRVKNGYHLTMLDALNILVLREKVKSILANYYKQDKPGLLDFDLDYWICVTNKFANNMAMTNNLNDFVCDSFIFEGSQGILLDQKYGVMPFCTPSNTTSENAQILLKEIGQTAVTELVSRPYITRHGNGPLCTNTNILDIKDENNLYNKKKKTFRSCKFDISLLEHSIAIENVNTKNINLNFSHANELSSDVLEQVSNLKTLTQINLFEFENIKTF